MRPHAVLGPCADGGHGTAEKPEFLWVLGLVSSRTLHTGDTRILVRIASLGTLRTLFGHLIAHSALRICPKPRELIRRQFRHIYNVLSEDHEVRSDSCGGNPRRPTRMLDLRSEHNI